MLLELILCIAADCPPLLALPSFQECTKRYEVAKIFEKNITEYAEECRRAHELAGSFTTIQRLMEAEPWERYAKEQAEAWYAATYVTYKTAGRYHRETYGPRVIKIWANHP